MAQQEKLILEAVSERDVDLLLLEEIHVSPAFRAWFLASIDSRLAVASMINAWHSVTDGAGESDILIVCHDDQQRRIAVLLENKITAPAQPAQADRYRERGEAGIRRGEWNEFVTAMIAPTKYLNSCADASRYHRRLSYEAIRDWLKDASDADVRGAYRASVIDLAIEQSRRGYQPVADDRVISFFDEYRQVLISEFPELVGPTKSAPSKESNWYPYRLAQLPEGRYLWHKFDIGEAALHFRGAGRHVAELEGSVTQLLFNGVHVKQAGKEAKLFIRVPVLRRKLPFGPQIDAARQGMRAAQSLFEISKNTSWKAPSSPKNAGQFRGPQNAEEEEGA